MARSRLALVSIGALATSCSLFTGLDGLSSGAVGGLDEGGLIDGGSVDARGAGDGPTDAPADAPSTKPRTWRLVPGKGPPGLHSARMAYDEARSKAVLYGGGGNDQQTTDTWQWDGTSWQSSRLAVTPGVRGAAALAYDSARQVTMLFAGSNSTPDPWQWNGSTWQSSGTSATSPGIAYSSAMTYDRARNVLVVFGGIRIGVTDDSDETWEWGTTSGFVNRKPTVSPTARHAHSVVYDSARSRVVVFGGAHGAPLNDTWEWDGTRWEQRMPPISPPARKGACAAYDSVRKVTVVFGGRPTGDNTKALADTWEWDGSAWRAGATGPSARSSCAMAFDSARNQVVMFGGSPRRLGATPSEVNDETWVYE